MRRYLSFSFTAVVLATSCGVAFCAEKAAVYPEAGLAYEWPGPGGAGGVTATPIEDVSASALNPLYMRVSVLWADIEKSQGVFDWTDTDALVDRFRAANYEIVLDLWGSSPLYAEDILKPPTEKDARLLDAWTRYLREAARHFKGRVRFFQIGRSPNSAAVWGNIDSSRLYAFLLKKAASTVRSQVKGAVIVSGGLAGADTAWLEKFFAAGAAPYVDVVCMRPDPKQDLATQIDAIAAAIQTGDASAKLWLEGVPAGARGAPVGEEMARRFLTAIEHGASLVAFSLPFGAAGQPVGAETIVRLHSALGAGFGRVPAAERIALLDPAGAPVPSTRTVAFYNTDKRMATIAYWSDGPGAPQTAHAKLSALRPGPPLVYDPVSGTQSEPHFEAEPGGAAGDVPLGGYPLFLVYREGIAGAPVQEGTESLEVSAARGITAEEVIAKYREFQAGQDAILQRYRSDAMINFHYRIAGYSTTIDVGMAGSYFFDPKVGAEWELRDFYINGNKSKWKEFPELPLVQPEKVLTLPLDITFDRSYTYEYDGEDTVDGRPCHVLSFNPVDPTKTLYRGKMWIDKNNWARVRVDSIQTKLDPPFVSSEEKTDYKPLTGEDGHEYWVVSRIESQQIYSAVGQSFVILREIDFTNHRINDTGFAEAHQKAYESNHQILRDTDKGFRYVDKDATGQRVVKENINTHEVFGLAGLLYDPSLQGIVPLLGVNYFDYDFLKKGIQTNVFFAGPLLNATIADPNFGGSGLTIGGNLGLTALWRTEKEYVSGSEDQHLAVRRRVQSISENIGRQIGDFFNLKASYELQYQIFQRDEHTHRDFTVPENTFVQTASLEGTFNRAGYEVRGAASYSLRQKFGFWGRPDGSDFNPDARGYQQYQFGASKEFFLRAFQKLRFSVDGYTGTDLDRFSRFSFDRFSTHVHGLGGSGIGFDKGAILRGAYMFNIANVIRLEAWVDQARVRTYGTGQDLTNHTGIGIVGSMLGPWKTIWQVDYGYAAASEVKSVRGNQELLLVVLKLF